MREHLMAFVCGFLLDLILGDPRWIPHPVCAIGKLISWMEKKTYGKNKKREEKKELWQGYALVLVVISVTGGISFGILQLASYIHPIVRFFVEVWMTYQLLATKCLKVESMKVYDALKSGSLEDARKAVAMIVGRDTENLDETQVAKATIETVAENTSDGVIAPMLFTAFAGPVFGWMYKAINTMDSMVGYKNEKYLFYGRGAAKLDDIVNYLPSRISALLMIGGAFLGGNEYSGKGAWKIFQRDRKNHASPNSAQTEAACAGALQIQLAGDAYYFGKIVSKPYIGDPKKEVECEDIRLANVLMYRTAWMGMIAFVAILCFFC